MLNRIFLLFMAVFLSAGCASLPENSGIDDRSVPFTREGNLHLLKGEFEQAITLYEKALELNPGDTEAYLNRGQAYAVGKGEYDLALSDYNKAIAINPDYAEAYYHRAKLFKQKEFYDLAISDYSKAIQINPNYSEAYTNRGVIYGRDKGQHDLAISDFNKSLELDPKLIEAYLNKASACEKAGYTQEAIQAYRSFIQHASPQFTEYILYAKKRIKDLEK